MQESCVEVCDDPLRNKMIVELVMKRGIPSGITLSFCSIASPAELPIAVTWNEFNSNLIEENARYEVNLLSE